MSDAVQEITAKMKTSCVAMVLLGLMAANSAFAQQICAGAAGKSLKHSKRKADRNSGQSTGTMCMTNQPEELSLGYLYPFKTLVQSN